MGKIVFDISMSLDGLITGPNPRPGQPLGEGGKRLHAWAFGGKTENDAFVLDEMMQTSGAIVAGRRIYDISRWGEKDPWGGHLPVFILTHAVPTGMAQTGAVYTFVTEGLESALNQAKVAAGDKNVQVIGIPISASNTSKPDCSMKSICTSSLFCLGKVSACLIILARFLSNWNPQGSSPQEVLRM